MKKLLWYSLAALAAMAAFSSCKDKPEPEPEPTNVVATVSASNLLDVAAAAYDAWEENTTIPESLTVGGKTLTLPQYQYAICKLLVNLASGDKSDVDVLGYKAADHPERDSYDQKEIAVTGGPKITEGTEDLVDIAKRMMAAMAEKLTVPNQTVITRTGESAIAFSTNRATVTILRALAEYKSKGSLPAKVSTDYLSAAATLKGFAQQFVGILDIWDKTVGTVSADGSHCTDNNSAWENVHFVPIPHSGGAYADGKDQYDAKYQPYFTVTIDGKEYTSAQTWGIALRGIMDLITTEGSAKKQVNRNPFEHTMGNGASLKEPIPAVTENDIWGQYPWYESTNDGPAINLDQFTPYLIARCASWFLTRQEALGKIGNYQFFCTDPEQGFVEDGVDGFVSSMRMWLIAARFYKYLLDNNITENVYDAVKNVTFATDLYGVEMPDIDLKTKSMTFVADGETKDAKFSAKKAWTASTTADWLKVEPASGDPGSEVTIKVTADPNTGDERNASIVIKGGNVTEGLEIPVIQGKYIAPTAATIKEFAQEYVKILNVWANTVGTIDMVTGEDYASGSNNVENAHYVPSTTTITVAGKTYNTADMFETAIRSYLLVRGFDGLDTQHYGAGSIGAREGGAASMSDTPVPVTHDYTWGSWPFNETEGNGGHFRTTTDEHCVAEVAVLDNWAMRSLNYSGGKPITNMCGYPRDPFNNYTGSFCSQRALITYAFFFKYMLDNNLDKADALADDTIIRTELFGDEGGEPIVGSTTILDFAKEYVKILDIWQNTTGEVVMHPDVPEETVANAHYIPSTTTINVNGKEYNTADMFETALRSYLLIRGYDGLETEKYGKNSIPALDGGAVAMSTTPVPETHGYTWGSAPFNETKGNGGHLVMGNDADGEHCKVKVDILDNWAMRSLNFQHGQDITNLCGYSGGQLAGYYGCFCSQRALITYAFFFKYMLDNNLDKGTQVSDDTIIRSELLGDEATAATIKDFAKEYVKILDIWQNTTGEVVMHPDVPEETVANAHYVPSTTTITVGGKTYNTADMFETALRSYLLIRGYNGLETEKYGKNSIPALDGGAVAMSETPVPETHGYTWGSAPFNETKGNGGHLVMGSDDTGEHCKVKVDILDNWAMRSLNFQHGQDITNLCGYSGGQLAGYYGCFCSQRALITYAFFFKYMLDNNLDKGTQVSDDTIIRSELLGDEAKAATIKDFAKEYVKILDIWQNTTGEVVMHPDVPEETVANAHYVPSTTTITVAGKTYNTADMFETALRSYLLIRGYDGLETEKYGKNSIPALDGGAVAMSETPVPETHGYTWGSAPFNETKGNGGHLVMGSDDTGEHCKVKVDILDNWAMRSLNFQHGQDITNLCGYSGGQLAGYYGCFCSQRALLTYAFFFKHMLDNNLEKGTEVSDSQIIRSELLGDEGAGEPTLKDFAKEFVKGLDVWQSTVGIVESEGKHLIEKGTAWENVHFIPVGKTGSAYDDHEGNQHDAKWTVWKMTVGGEEYTSSQAWEIAIRGLMNLVTAEGEAFLPTMDNRNKAYTLANNAKFSTAPIPSATAGNKWGLYPWYEADDDYSGLTFNGGPVTEVDVNFMVKVGAWHVVRSFVKTSGNTPLEKIGNYQQFGTGSGTLNLEGYEGYIAPMRELLILMRIYKDLLDSNIDANVYDAIKDKKYSFDLYGI